ncbi:MAG: dTDP-4-dehydrorhamnose reductase [Bacteroidaceae bacterium]|nr:dTDP-4-dehydrorhamnose reductase [Bacteroidaceae bacterium]
MKTNSQIVTTPSLPSERGVGGEGSILVTGACGQLGNEMQLQAKQHPEYNWFFTDIISPEGSDIQVLDICSQEAVTEFVQAHQIDILVNCAAYTAVDKAESDPEKANMLNAIAVGFLSLAMEHRHGQMIQISTDYVFDGTAHTPYTEDLPTSPNSVYGRTKLSGEIALKVNNPSGMIIRTAWLYSRFGNNFVKTMLRLGRERKELGVIFDQIGTPTYARDLASAIMSAIRHGIVPGTYHFSNEGVCSWYDFTRAIHRLGGITDCQVRPLHTSEYPTPAARPHYSVLDKTKFKQTYNFDIPYWEDSLRECIGELAFLN